MLDLFTESVGSDDDRAALSEEQLRAEEELQVTAISAATAGPLNDSPTRELFAREQKLLDQMTEIAEESRALPDGRISAAYRVDSREPMSRSSQAGQAVQGSSQVERDSSHHLHRVR